MNISVDQKTDKLIQATLSDEDGTIDLTNVTLTWRFWDDDTVVIEKTTTDGIDVTDAVNGKIEMELDNTDTDISGGKYKFELLLEDVENNRYLPAKGLLSINSNKSSEVV
jgi:hypothetical protein